MQVFQGMHVDDLNKTDNICNCWHGDWSLQSKMDTLSIIDSSGLAKMDALSIRQTNLCDINYEWSLSNKYKTIN